MKKQIKLLTTLTLLLFMVTSCSKDDDPAPTTTNPDPVVTNHAYMGTWSGTFEGDDNGTWDMEVDKDGKFTGTAFSNGGQSTLPMTGSIDDKGVLTAEIDVNGTILDFTGQGVDGKTASGTWNNPDAMISGTWSGSIK